MVKRGDANWPSLIKQASQPRLQNNKTDAMKTDPQLKESILKAAAQIFSTKGYVAASLETIAESAETDPESIRRVFGSKANLGAIWLNSLHAGSLQRHKQLLDKDRAPECKIRDYFQELKPWLIQNKFLGCPFTAVGKQESSVCPQVAETVDAHRG